ncbi:hypothetical protein BAUCODRAFT_116392 [Baudoinia panamericana UAMH 10762]|uniref:LYC1 C-terminal domain-containing protein n=1 Tax=Baudoinia panamericana (strain UAMH 10762) TaxID=717646 RepID=M2M4Q1_BAUPA|nr:uncharacterized protein BAUCODRAFT_116392 [Baudoinia panamericana UAMH 10762]EMC91586.1 hypothetical protein BAUCODRAFT_116392 [Baudoinia panamericana UAMH 10762]
MDFTLPDKSSPDLRLVMATTEEHLAQQNANSEEWRGALSLEAYLRREDHLLNQALTQDGGLTPWMLVYQPPDGGPRHSLCGCESIKKKALVSTHGRVEDVVAHGIASVFCPPKYRGKGYAGRMMTELGKRLKTWQVAEGSHSAFSVLYSDIGKDFYAARGWQPFPSAHITLPPLATPRIDVEGIQTLQSEDLPNLCALDEKLLRIRLSKLKGSSRTTVALLPDVTTLNWHHAREDFVSTELHGGRPGFMDGGRGALVQTSSGSRVWCYWTRVWTNPQEEAPNTLHILRLVVEDEQYSSFEPASEQKAVELEDRDLMIKHALARLLCMAQLQAHASGMKEVQIWNPTLLTLAAARLVKPKAAVENREKESIASLQWYGGGSWKDIDWVCNEKYGWC